MNRSVVGFLILSVALSACQKKQESAPEGDSKRRMVIGSVSKAADKIYQTSIEEGNYSPCDLQQENIRMEITQALDRKTKEIESFQATPGSSNRSAWTSTSTEIGQMTIVESNRPKVEENKWETDTFGWPQIIAKYNKIKNQPVNKDWLDLNVMVRGILPDDEDRIVHWINYEINPFDRDNIDQLSAAVDACLEQDACVTLTLSAIVKSFAQRNTIYSQYLKYFEYYRSQPSKVRSMLARFKNRLSGDLKNFFLFRKGNHELDIQTKTITVRMDEEVFGGNSHLVNKYIEPIWSQHGLTVKVLWNQVNQIFDVFKIVKMSANERAFVAYKERIMSLPELVRGTTISHEFGHVLGLKDEYFYVWKKDKCYYDEYTNAGSIMSQSSTGKVLDKHIQQILKGYFPN